MNAAALFIRRQVTLRIQRQKAHEKHFYDGSIDSSDRFLNSVGLCRVQIQ